jgi:CheY-like chemotaxis protein
MTTNKAKILCVDDQWSGLEGRKMLLEERGYDVLIATSGATALRLFSSHPLDLALLDYHMPEMNGDIVAEHMKAAQPDVPVVMLSADEDLPASTLQLVDAFLSKSESPASLIKVVEHALEAHLTGIGIREGRGAGADRLDSGWL